MVMSEIRIAPSEHPVVRRWFEGTHLDLIVWETPAGEMLRFRLLSRQIGDEVEGFYWDKQEGLRHGHLPSTASEIDWAGLGWVSELRGPSIEFVQAWRSEGPTLPPLIYAFVQEQIERALCMLAKS